MFPQQYVYCVCCTLIFLSLNANVSLSLYFAFQTTSKTTVMACMKSWKHVRFTVKTIVAVPIRHTTIWNVTWATNVDRNDDFNVAYAFGNFRINIIWKRIANRCAVVAVDFSDRSYAIYIQYNRQRGCLICILLLEMTKKKNKKQKTKNCTYVTA